MKNYYTAFFVFLAAFLLLIYFFIDVVSNYFPSGDEISLIVNSSADYGAQFSEWFSNGFHGYFTSYPEWNDNAKTIMRPAVNSIFFINSIIFKDNYGLYLLFTYFIHSLSCAFVFIICAEYLKLRYIFCFLGAILMFINPSVTNPDFFFHPGFAFDAFAAVLFFICYFILNGQKKYYYIIYIFIAAALLTKEISILPCVLIPVTLYIRLKQRSYVFIYPVILTFVIYIIIKNYLGFETLSDSSLDHFKNIKEFSFSMFKTILIYPAGYYSLNDMSKFYQEFYFSAGTTIVSMLFVLIPEILSLIIGVILLLKRKSLEKIYSNQNFRILFIWTFLILLYLILVGLDLRFAYSFYLFFIPLVFSLFKLEKKYRSAAALFLLCFFIFNLIKFSSVLTNFKDKNITKYKISRQLTEEFKRIDNDNPVILVNDVSAMFGSNSLSRFCGKKNNIVKINSLNFYGSEDIQKPFSEIKITKDSFLTIYLKNINTDFLFEGVNKKFNHPPAVEFPRNDSISYFFPDELLQKTTFKGKNIYNFGTILQIKIKTQTPLNILYFDTNETKYTLVKY